jgi:hypothetical protein
LGSRWPEEAKHRGRRGGDAVYFDHRAACRDPEHHRRVLLERAAYRLPICDLSVLEVAVEAGYSAMRRSPGRSSRARRRRGGRHRAGSSSAPRTGCPAGEGDCYGPADQDGRAPHLAGSRSGAPGGCPPPSWISLLRRRWTRTGRRCGRCCWLANQMAMWSCAIASSPTADQLGSTEDLDVMRGRRPGPGWPSPAGVDAGGAGV